MIDQRQQALAEAIDELCRHHVTPDYVRRCDVGEAYPEAAMSRLAEAGWAELATSREPGRALDLATVHMALARHSLAPKLRELAS